MPENPNTAADTTADLETNTLWNRFQTTAEEMFDVVTSQAFSVVMSEWNDACSVVMTPEGSAIGMSKRCTPVLAGTVSRATRIMLDEHFDADDLEPGDALISNDPWDVGGHLPDFVVVEPVFYEGELVAFVGSLGHVGEIGGNRGMWVGDSQQFYEEGLDVPPLKLYEAGEINESVEGIVRGNVRVPNTVMGDIEALHSGNTAGADRVHGVLDEYGPDTVERVGAKINRLAERTMRNEIEKLDDGTYESVVDFTVGDEEFSDQMFDLAVDVTLTIDGDEVTVDFTGTSEQTASGLNSPFCSVRAFTNYVVQCMTVPDLNPADGAYEPIEIVAPEGTIVNASRPAAVDSRHFSYFRATEAVTKAFAEVVSERAITSYGAIQISNFSGVDENGDEFIIASLSNGQMPARRSKDGINSVMFPDNATIVPMEIFEQYCPIVFEQRSFARDSEGAGEYRSGMGDEVVFRNPLDHEVHASIISNNNNDNPDGLEGGLEGSRSTAESLTHDRPVPTFGRTMFKPGERIRLRTATSGGFGDPEDRDKDLVEQDVRDGYVSEERAREVYSYER
jgi:N-methylhydantoinase B/oxoprolinase/acetone carboxylase alpha subunit